MKLVKGVIVTLLVAIAAPAGAVGRLADLTVYDRTEGRQLPVHWHQGRAYVVGRPGNEYQVSLRNRQGDDVLAVVSVDGVNVITGQSAAPHQSGYVLSPRGGMDILGWRKSMAETAAFYFTPLADSYAARTGRPHDVGVIGVALYRRKKESQPIARAAPAPEARAEASRDSSLGTGHGRIETSHATRVIFERATIDPAEVITLYYDSLANLVARGVIREPVPVAPLYPRPFPGFVPDPGA